MSKLKPPNPDHDVALPHTQPTPTLGLTTCQLLHLTAPAESPDHFWQNWPKTHAYVAQKMFFPTTVYQLANAIAAAEKDRVPLRVVGGGWSFSEASLPGGVATERPGVDDVERLVRILPEATTPTGEPLANVIDPDLRVDLGALNTFPPTPDSVASVLGGPPERVYLIDTRQLVSSLQGDLAAILSAEAVASGKIYFHVEAGISMAALVELLAHHSPRASLLSSGGAPGATLAGSLASSTHGAEHRSPVLADRVKAIHLVGPGGLQWWIEGDEPIADLAKLRAAYPCIAANRVIRGKLPVDGLLPQDWLSAVAVSLGAMGAIYSVVLEVEPLAAVHQVTVQTRWSEILDDVYQGIGGIPNTTSVFDFVAKLRNPPSSSGGPPVDPDGGYDDGTGPYRKPLLPLPLPQPAPLPNGAAARFSEAFVRYLIDGSANGTGIDKSVCRYANLAIDPVRRAPGEYDCWIVNREEIPLPFDQPPKQAGPSGSERAVVDALVKSGRLPQICAALGITIPNDVRDPAAWSSTLFQVPQSIQHAIAIAREIASAKDTINVALRSVLGRISDSPVPGNLDAANALLTSYFAAQFGTIDGKSDLIATPGMGGFPAGGLVGAGIEIAMPAAEVFEFLQRTILDKLPTDRPCFGYISIRLCRQTTTLLGMQQWDPISVMIEVVAFGDATGRKVVSTLQADTLRLIAAGQLDAMLHWGLENDQLTAAHLDATHALKRPTSSKLSRLDAFRAVRALIRAASGVNGPLMFRAFDSNFTRRLKL